MLQLPLRWVRLLLAPSSADSLNAGDMCLAAGSSSVFGHPDCSGCCLAVPILAKSRSPDYQQTPVRHGSHNRTLLKIQTLNKSYEPQTTLNNLTRIKLQS